MKTTLPAITALWVAGIATAQPFPLPPRGAFSSVPISPIFAESSPKVYTWSGAVNASVTQIGNNGPLNVPDFRMDTIRVDLFPNATAGSLVFDGYSTANDFTPVAHTQGQFRLASQWENSWATLFVSVSSASGSNTPWATTGSFGTGAEIGSFYVDNTALHNIIDGETYLEHSADDAAQALPAFPGTNPDITAVDGFASLIVERQGVTEPGILTVVDEIYFSVSPGSASDLQGAGYSDIHEGSIYSAKWVNGKWTTLEEAASYSELGLGETDNVDSVAVWYPLAVNGFEPGSVGIIFSATGSVLDDQIMVSADLLGGAPEARTSGPLRRSNGTKVSVSMGLSGEDEVDGVCGRDPEVTDASEMFGSPLDPTAVLPPPLNTMMPMSLSIYRPYMSADLRCVISGWGNGTAATTTLLAAIWIPGQPSIPPIWFPIPQQRPDTADVFEVTVTPPFAPTGLKLEFGIFGSAGSQLYFTTTSQMIY